jgi:undecaprenyl-diphosphatase
MTFIQTILISVIQGITELFPISSVAHAVLTPFVFGWALTPEFLKLHFLPFVVMLHLGTAVALLLFFWRDWLDFAKSTVDARATVARAVLLRIVIGTVPAVIIGFVLEKKLNLLFSSITSAAVFLIVNGVLLYFGEKLRGRGARRIEEIGYVDALLVGLAQSLALVPGFSRSGASIVAGFWTGLTHEEAARFSMLLGTPIIAGAAVLEVPKLLHGESGAILEMATIGGAISGVVAFFSVWALMTWFKRHEFNAMFPFALYCWLVGAAVLVVAH